MGDYEETKMKSPWKLITSTVVVCATVFVFIYTYTLNIKNARIELLKERVEILKDVGAVPKAVKRLQEQIESLQEQLRPLTLVTKVDPITGRAESGVMSFGTTLTQDLTEAQDLLKEKKYDLALAKAVEMEEKLPNFLGATYIRFKVNEVKGYKNEAAKHAQKLIEGLPKDQRIQEVYIFLIDHLISQNKKKDAENLGINALQLWSDDKELSQSFERVFGYKPSIKN